jgi:hypothetical protein
MSAPKVSARVPLAETFWNGDRCAAIRGTAYVTMPGSGAGYELSTRRPVVAVSLGDKGVAYFYNPHNDTWESMVNRRGQGIDPAYLQPGSVSNFRPTYPDEAYARGNWWAGEGG